MQLVLHDHGEIIHFSGRHQLFPVRGGTPDDLAFARPGELEGRTPIGWNTFFPALARSGRVVVVDDEAGNARVARPDEAPPSPSA